SRHAAQLRWQGSCTTMCRSAGGAEFCCRWCTLQGNEGGDRQGMICDILIVGGEGDLAYRKLYPALYHLDCAGCLSDCVRIVAIARNPEAANSFPEKVRSKFEQFHGSENLDEKKWQRFAARLQYYALDATSETDLSLLRNQVFTNTVRDLIVYLATPPAIFAPICQSLWAVGLVRENSRLVVEKP